MSKTHNKVIHSNYPIELFSCSDYEAALKRGFFPLHDWRRFEMANDLRKYLTDEIFSLTTGARSITKSNLKFYHVAWKISQHYCEECGLILHHYNACFISHILTKQAHPEHAFDLRNYNILCKECHNKWEYGVKRDMKIFRKNQLAIEAMRKY